MSPHPRAALFTFEGHEDLTYPEGHPFRPERAGMLMDILRNEGLLDAPWLEIVGAEPAATEDLSRFHPPEYLSLLERAGNGEMLLEMLEAGLGSPDCPVFLGVWHLARLAAGATLAGARLVADGAAEIAFNPIGGFHHAGPSSAEGFCYVNDVACACLALVDRGLRVASIDLDVHHGNGTEAAFLADPRVLTVSVHETGRTLYPGTGFETEIGQGDGRGFNLNVPLPAGTDDDAYLRAIREVVMRAVPAFAPDVVLLEIGMDVLAGDPLAHLRLTNNATAEAARLVGGLGRPLLVTGGGGYHPGNTARGWALAWSVLCGAEPADDFAGLVGGVLLGDAGRRGGLRDMRIYASGWDREDIDREVDRVIEFHREVTLPLLGAG